MTIIHEDGHTRITVTPDMRRVNVETRLFPDDTLGAQRWDLACWGVLHERRRVDWRMCKHGEHQGTLGNVAASLVAMALMGGAPSPEGGGRR